MIKKIEPIIRFLDVKKFLNLKRKTLIGPPRRGNSFEMHTTLVFRCYFKKATIIQPKSGEHTFSWCGPAIPGSVLRVCEGWLQPR